MKRGISITIEEDDYEDLKLFCEKTGLTVSKLYEEHTNGLLKAVRLSGILRKEKVSKLDLLRFFAKGVTQEV